MKRFFLLCFISAFVWAASAQTADKKWGVGIGAGAYGNIEQEGVGFMPQLQLSRYVSPTFDLMLVQNVGLFNSSISNDLDVGNTLLNLRFKLYNGLIISESSAVKPYLYAGPGFLLDNQNNGMNVNFGLGSKFSLGHSLSLFLEGGYIDGVKYKDNAGNDQKENMWKAIAGLEVNLGKAKDSDGDGVSDNKDDCPETPFGVSVDENGCPIDSDGDGVVDFIDDCPQLVGLTSLRGCPDADGDGVADKNDDCPGIPGEVDLAGCPDSDGDGVADKGDACPDTPEGVAVSPTGCPLDNDNDGIANVDDDCPDEAGVAENNGCPPVEPAVPVKVDVKIIPVYFVLDKSYLTDYTKGKLNRFLKLMGENPDYKVNLYGYTDDLATQEYNLSLSEERIQSVVEYLTSSGLDKSRIAGTEARGELDPIASNAEEDTRKYNRRVEFEVLKLQ